MNAYARLHEQRSCGQVNIRMERDGVAVLREVGSSKVRLARHSHEAVLINTSGGLAGGDQVIIDAEAGEGARLTLTSQTAERVYRSLGPAADVRVNLRAKAKATLYWLPQESILFEASCLKRQLDVDLAQSATFLALESVVFGRLEMGEVLRQVSFQDNWNVRQGDQLVHAERFKIGPELPVSQVSLGEARAMATLLYIASDAEQVMQRLELLALENFHGSRWNGKLVARCLARDGFALKKTLLKALVAFVGAGQLPKVWTF